MQRKIRILSVFLLFITVAAGSGCGGKKSYTMKDIKFIQFFDPT